MTSGDLGGMALRIEARRAAGGGLSYRMGFDAPRDEETPFVSEGVTLVVDAESAPLVEELVLDFEEGEGHPEGGEFVFINPKDVPAGPLAQEIP